MYHLVDTAFALHQEREATIAREVELARAASAAAFPGPTARASRQVRVTRIRGLLRGRPAGLAPRPAAR